MLKENKLSPRVSYLKIIKLKSTTSTNDEAYLWAKKGAKEITVVWAKAQTKGRGRLGRRWESPSNKGLYLSFIFKPHIELRRVNLLGMTVALSVVKALRDIIELKIKWPNDIIVGGKKIGGVLLETETLTRYPAFVIVGLGLNINTPRKYLPFSATSIFLRIGRKYFLDKIFQLIIKEVIIWYRYFKNKKYKKIIKEINKYLDTVGKNIIVYTNKKKIKGKAYRVGEYGELYIEDKDGRIKRIFVSEIIHLR